MSMKVPHDVQVAYNLICDFVKDCLPSDRQCELHKHEDFAAITFGSPPPLCILNFTEDGSIRSIVMFNCKSNFYGDIYKKRGCRVRKIEHRVNYDRASIQSSLSGALTKFKNGLRTTAKAYFKYVKR